MGRSDGNLGLLVLKVICVSFCLFSVLLLTPAFRSAGPNSHLRDLISILNAAIFAVGFYGIQRKARLTWQLGWFAGGFLLIEWLVVCLASSLRVSHGWIGPAVLVLAGFGVGLYWGYWWKRQKSYFIPD